MSHTPGPWDIYEADDDSIRIATDERRICEIAIYLDHVDCANARLIAAAPEMLVALKAIVKAGEKLGNDYSWLDLAKHKNDVRDIARAAIANAEKRGLDADDKSL